MTAKKTPAAAVKLSETAPVELKSEETAAVANTEAENSVDEFKQPYEETINEPNMPNEETFEPVIKSGFRKVRIKDFFGSYKDARFDDDSICEKISDTTLEDLLGYYPALREKVEVLD